MDRKMGIFGNPTKWSFLDDGKNAHFQLVFRKNGNFWVMVKWPFLGDSTKWSLDVNGQE